VPVPPVREGDVDTESIVGSSGVILGVVVFSWGSGWPTALPLVCRVRTIMRGDEW